MAAAHQARSDAEQPGSTARATIETSRSASRRQERGLHEILDIVSIVS